MLHLTKSSPQIWDKKPFFAQISAQKHIFTIFILFLIENEKQKLPFLQKWFIFGTICVQKKESQAKQDILTPMIVLSQ